MPKKQKSSTRKTTGKHMMPDGKMMSDSEMKKMMSRKSRKY